jgi:hypothetical protein
MGKPRSTGFNKVILFENFLRACMFYFIAGILFYTICYCSSWQLSF